jgi:hypothetical protein
MHDVVFLAAGLCSCVRMLEWAELVVDVCGSAWAGAADWLLLW